jgi:hypothetical protein
LFVLVKSDEIVFSKREKKTFDERENLGCQSGFFASRPVFRENVTLQCREKKTKCEQSSPSRQHHPSPPPRRDQKEEEMMALYKAIDGVLFSLPLVFERLLLLLLR